MKAHSLARRSAAVGCTALLALTAACSGSSGSGSGSADGSAKSVSLRLSCACSERDSQGISLKKMVDEVKEKSKGKVQIKLYLNSSLYDQKGEETALLNGTLDMANTAPAFLTDRDPAISILTVPYLVKSPEQMQALSDGPIGKKLFDGVEQKTGAHILTTWYLGTRTLDLKDVGRINTPADMASVKLRVPDAQSWIDLGKSLGAKPTPTSFSELYTALQTGTVDGQDNPLGTDKVQHFEEVTSQIVLTNHLVDIVMPAVSKRAWSKLSADDQKILTDAAKDAAKSNLALVKGQEASILKAFKAKGLKVYTPDVAAFSKYALNYYMTKTDYPKQWDKGMFDEIKSMPSS